MEMTELRLTTRLEAKLLPKWFFLHTHQRLSESKNPPYLLSFDVDLVADVKVLPKLARLMKKYRIAASFAVIGEYVTSYPKEHRTLLETRAEFVNHSYTHPFHEALNPLKISELSARALEEEITKTGKAIERVLGVTTDGWRTPHFGVQPIANLHKKLKKLGYRYSSSVADYRTKSSSPFLVEGVYEIPASSSSKFPMATFDSWSYLARPRPILKNPDEFLALWKNDLLLAKKHGFLLNHYFDPSHLIDHGVCEKMFSFISEQGIDTLTYSEFLNKGGY